jgi:hypothetical protein
VPAPLATMSNGIVMPLPPCCAIDCCKSSCETTGFCEKLGKIGFKSVEENRAKVMYLASFLSFLSIIFCIVAVTSISTVGENVKNTCWTYGQTSSVNFYVGLEAIVIDADGMDDLVLKWDDALCNEPYCDDCKEATSGSVTTAIMSLITCIPTLATDLQRSTRKGDLNCQKFMALFTGFVGTISTLVALSTYADGCFRNLPDKDASGDDINWGLGPGFSMLLIATFLKPLDMIFHMLLPVVKDDEDAQDLKL